MERLTFNDGENGCLMCRHCGGDYLHQGAVGVWNREEDQNVPGFMVDITGGIRIAEAERNPSPRRSGVSIMFDCEQCGIVGKLFIIQHKGQTFIGWSEDD